MLEVSSEVAVSGAPAQAVGVVTEELLGLVVGALDDAQDAAVGVLEDGVSEELLADAVELLEECLEGLVEVSLVVREPVS